MNQKLLIVLFSAVLYNGVTYSSPIKEQVPDTKLSEAKLSETLSVTDGIKKNVEPSVVTSADHLVSGASDATPVPQHSEISTILSTKVTSHPIDKSTAANSSISIVQNGSQDSFSQNTSKVADNKTSSQGVEDKNTNSTDDVPNNKKSIEPTSTNAPSTSVASTSAAVTSATAVSVKTTIKPTISTVAPTPTLKNKVVTNQSTPAPAEEKHFDGPSFIGGIVLTIGLTAIGFIAFKYYKSGKIDKNYRTL